MRVELADAICVYTAIFQKMDTSMGLSSIASLSLGLSMSMTGTPGGAMMMKNLGVNAGPLQRLGGGPFHRSNNSLSKSPRPPRSPDTEKTPDTTVESAQPSAAASGEHVNRPSEDGDVPRTTDSPAGRIVADGVRQKVSVDVEPTPVDVLLPPSTFADSIVLFVPQLTTVASAVVPAPPPRTSSVAGASDGPVSCLLLSPDDNEATDISQPTISISLDSSDDDEDGDVPPTSSSSAESISHILSSTQLSVEPRSCCVYNGPVNTTGALQRRRYSTYILITNRRQQLRPRGAATWRTRQNIRVVFDSAHCLHCVTSSTKPEVHKILHDRREILGHATDNM